MKVEELTIIRITPPSKKKRKELDIWNESHQPELYAAIRKCLETKERQIVERVHGHSWYIIDPVDPLIPEAMERIENLDVLHVSINVLHPAFHLLVRREEGDKI